MEKYLFRAEVQIKEGSSGKEGFSCRILSEDDMKNMTQDAISHLVDLRLNFLICDADFEDVLLDIAHVPTIIDLECLKGILDYKGIINTKIIN